MNPRNLRSNNIAAEPMLYMAMANACPRSLERSVGVPCAGDRGLGHQAHVGKSKQRDAAIVGRCLRGTYGCQRYTGLTHELELATLVIIQRLLVLEKDNHAERPQAGLDAGGSGQVNTKTICRQQLKNHSNLDRTPQGVC